MLSSLPSHPPPPPGTPISFVLALGRALHRYGTPAHRLELALSRVSERLGEQARFFSTPTAIFASFGPPEALRTSLIRVDPGEMDLARLSGLDGLVQAVIRGERGAQDGAEELQALLTAPAPYRPPLVLLCYALVAGCWARLFGGGPREMALASLCSLLVGLLSVGAERLPALGRVLEPVAALGVAALAAVGAALFGPLQAPVVTLAGLIVLLPGLSLTVAVNEIATRNLLSGAARLTGTALVFLQLGFGAALGGRLSLLLPPRVGPLLAAGGGWLEALVLPVGLAATCVLFRARPRDVGWIVAAGALAYAGTRTGSALLGPELGAFVGALLLGLTGNVLARWRNRPAVITLVPGLLVLVPGSVGFRSLESLMARDTLTGLGTAFTMVMVTVSLVAGLLLANALVPSRRVL